MSATSDSVSCHCNLASCECISEQQLLPRLSETNTPTSSDQHQFNKIEIPAPGTILTVEKSTTDATLAYLLQQLNVRIIHIQLAYLTASELVALMLKVSTAIENHYIRRPFSPAIGRAIELNGRNVRCGRLRNDLPIELETNSKVMLTSNPAYDLVSTKDVLYLSNFFGYLTLLKPGDFIFINTTHRIQLAIAKVTAAVQTITCCVLYGGSLKSYADVTLPYLLETGKTPNEIDRRDCQAAQECGADFIVVPNVTDLEYIACVRTAMAPMTIPLLANIELAVLNDPEALDEVISRTDGIWMDKYSKEIIDFERYVIGRARKLGKSIAVAFPDFRFRLEPDYEHFLFTETDTLLLKRLGQMHVNAMKRSLRRYAGRTLKTHNEYVKHTKTEMVLYQQPTIVLNLTIVTSLLLGASLIITTVDSTGALAIRLSQQRPRCYILAVLPSGAHELARKLTQWKCIRPLLYEEETSNASNWRRQIEKRLKFGLTHAKLARMVAVGDLVIYCYDLKDDNSETERLSYQTSYLAEEIVHCIV